VIVAYHLARLLAPREPLIEDRVYVGGAAIATGTVVTPETKLNGEVACEIDPWIAGEFACVVERGRIGSGWAFRRPG